jgi:predicted GIY-YIG superfamily endonuclease
MSCVYILRHPSTGLFYIGSTSNYIRRQSEHRSRLRHGTHNSSLIQYAYNNIDKGLVWEEIPTATKEEAIELERKMIIENKDDPLLANERLAKLVSEEVRKIMSDAHKASWTPERRAERALLMTGTKHTEETKRKIREKARGIDEATRKAAAEKNRVGITAFGVNYRTAQEAGKAFNLDIGTILNRARSDKPRWNDWSITPKE